MSVILAGEDGVVGPPGVPAVPCGVLAVPPSAPGWRVGDTAPVLVSPAAVAVHGALGVLGRGRSAVAARRKFM